MADFNAGSIEGTLDLDTAPFASGLRKAKMEADDFSRKKVSAKASLDNTELDAKDRMANETLDRLDHKKVSAKADLDISEAEAKAAILNRTLSKALDAGGLGRAATNPALMVGKLLAMAGAFMSVAAAAGPATAVVAGFGGAAAVAFGGAAIALGLFAKVVTSDMTNIQKAIKKGIDLKGPAGLAETALKHLTSAWKSFQRQAGGVGYKVLTTAFTGLAGILPRLVPLLKATGNGVNDILKQVFALTKTPLFDHFIASLTKFMHGFLSGAGPIIRSLLSSFMHAFMVLQPLMDQLGHGIQLVVQHLAGFTSGGGLAKFVGYVQHVAPEVLHLLGAVVHGLLALGAGLAPLAGPALHFITALVIAIGGLHIAPVAAGFAAVLHALQPILPVARELLNVALKPIGQLLTALAHGPIAAIVHGLRGELQPAFHSLGSILHSLVKPVAAFLASIANLANPTGIHLVSVLLKTLAGVVRTVAPALGHLAVALESVIDNGIEAILPLLPKLAPLFQGAAHAAAALAGGLAAILSHKSVAYMILGIVAAIKGYQLAMRGVAAAEAAWASVTTAVNVLKDACIGTRIGLAALAAQEMATAVAGRAAAVASRVWAAAQWLLNAALDANPIGIVVVAIGALVAGLIYAYNHSKTFRTIVNAAFHAVADAARTVFNWLKNAVSDVINFIHDHWQMLVGIFLGPLALVVALVITHWDQIRNYTVNLISGIISWFSNGWAHLVSMTSNFVSNVVQFFAQLPGKIANFAGQMVNAGQNLMTSIWHGLEAVWNNIWGWVTGLPGKIVSVFSNIGSNISGAIHSAISGAVSSLPGPLASIAHHLGLATGGVTTGLTHAMIGDNPGGREAVIPLDKYEIPSKGDTARTQAALISAAHAGNERTNSLLSNMAATLQALLGKTGSPEELAVAVGSHSAATMRQLAQIQRAAK